MMGLAVSAPSEPAVDGDLGVGGGHRRVGQVDLGGQRDVLQVLFQRVGPVDGQVVDLAGLQGGQQRGLGLRDAGVRGVLQHRGGQARIVVVALGELEHLQDLVARRVGGGVGPADVHAGPGQHLVPVRRGQLAGALAVAGVGEGDLVRHEPHVPAGVRLGRVGHQLGDQRVVRHAEHVVGLAELGDVPDIVRARAELRMDRHAGILLPERRQFRCERGRQGARAEHDQRAGRARRAARAAGRAATRGAGAAAGCGQGQDQPGGGCESATAQSAAHSCPPLLRYYRY